jgi:hypothetical protein
VKYVLFVCTHNAGRSQMAQAFCERHAPPDIRAESPAKNPPQQSGPTSSRRCARSRSTSPSTGRRSSTSRCNYTPTGRSRSPAAAPAPTSPQSSKTGDSRSGREKPRESRGIRDLLEERARDLVEHRFDPIRADQTAHQIRLERLPNLVEEFEGIRSPDVIRGCADAILAEFDGAGAILRAHARRQANAGVPPRGALRRPCKLEA